MKLATRRTGSADGQLVVVSPDGDRCVVAPVPTLRQAIERWATVDPLLRAMADFSGELDPARLRAPRLAPAVARAMAS